MKFFSRICYCVLLFVSCIGCTPKSQHTQKFDIQGHRGCRGLLPENSMIGFEKAMNIGVHTLEMDVVISKDHKVVVSHEPFMNHEIAFNLQGNSISESEEKNYNIYQMAYDSIRQYDCGTKNHPRFPKQEKIEVSKPLLSNVIEMAEKHSKNSINYNIEIKRKPSYDGIYVPKVDEFVRLVLNVIQKHNLGSRVNLQSFDIETLEEIKKQSPNMELALLVDEDENMSEKLKQLSFTPKIMSPYYKLLTKENIREYQRTYGMKVIPWTVNEEADMQKLIDLEVNGIITDYPDVLKKLCDK